MESKSKSWPRSVRRAVKRYRRTLSWLGDPAAEDFADDSAVAPENTARIGHLHVMDVIRARRVVDKWGREYDE